METIALQKNNKSRKTPVGVSFDIELLEWVDGYLENDFHFMNRSHFIEVLIREYRLKVENEGK